MESYISISTRSKAKSLAFRAPGTKRGRLLPWSLDGCKFEKVMPFGYGLLYWLANANVDHDQSPIHTESRSVFTSTSTRK